MSAIFDRMYGKVKNTGNLKDKRINIAVADLAELLKEHPDYKPEEHVHVEEVIQRRKDDRMEKRTGRVGKG